MSIEKLQLWMQAAGALNNGFNSQDLAGQTKVFKERLSEYSEQVQQYMLEMYANPVINKYRINT